MSAHSKLAPSSYGRLAFCRAAPTMEWAYPSEDTLHSREGRAAHFVAQQMFLHGYVLALGTPLEGVEVTEEMIQGAHIYIDEVRAAIGGDLPGLQIEERVSLEGLHPEAFGTLDARAKVGSTLYLWDYKYGHKYVDVFENYQMIAYSYALTADMLPDDVVAFTIVQPRSYHPEGPVRSWTVRVRELEPFYDILRHWLKQAMGERVLASPHPEACRDCSARYRCVPLRNAGYEAMDFARRSEAHDLSSLEVGTELARVEDMAALLDAYRTGLQEEVEGALRKGTTVPNYTMSPGSSTLKWVVPEEMVAQLDGRLWAPPKLITPTQARDRKLIPSDVLEAYAERSPGALKLSRVDHKLAKKVFK